MTEEEKEAIKTTKAILKEWQKIVDIEDPEERDIEMSCYIEEMPFLEMKTLLKIIKKQQKEIKQLANGIRVLGTNPDITTEEIIKEFTEKPISEEYMKEFNSRYISKDKVLKALGYEENDEEYDRLKQDDEKLLAILDTLYSEVCRLEDIEDQKTMLEIHNIENMRDKYWQKKINNKTKELEDYKKTLTHTKENEDVYLPQSYVIKQFKSLLKE